MVLADPNVVALLCFALIIALATLTAALLKEPPDFIWGITAEGDDAAAEILQDSALQALQDSGVKHYRMSLPWAKLCQHQTANNPVCHENAEAVESYGNALRELKRRGIEPVVSMWQWNTPQKFDKHIGGFNNTQLMPLFFYHYAKTLFKHFNNDVRFWITLSDPDAALENGTGFARHVGEREVLADPYVRSHSMILSHAEAFRAWREAGSKGEISMALGGGPHGSLFFDPVFRGDYSADARRRHKDLLEFNDSEKLLVHGSHMGVYYLNTMTSKDPDELRTLLRYLSDAYGGIRIMITQGHSAGEMEQQLGLGGCSSIRERLLGMVKAVAEDNVHVYGYFAAAAPGDLAGNATRAMQWFASDVMPLKQLPPDGQLPPCVGHAQLEQPE